MAWNPGTTISEGWKSAGGSQLGKELGFSQEKQKKTQKEKEAQFAAYTPKVRANLDRQLAFDDTYLRDINQLRGQAQNQAIDARNTYSNTLQPRLMENMERAQFEAAGRMTLDEVGDLNNYMHQQARDLYENQAQQVRQRGLADAGILQAMGAQATATQMGGLGAPLTGSQLQLLHAGNQQQSALAFNRTQQEMERLRQLGIERGFEQSDLQYRRGLDAQNRYDQSIANYENAFDRSLGRNAAFRQEDLGYATLGHGILSQGIARDMGFDEMVHSGNMENLNARIAMADAQNAARSGLFAGAITGGAAGAGALIGGPSGAAAGAQVGSAATSGLSNAGQSGLGLAGNSGQVGTQSQNGGGMNAMGNFLTGTANLYQAANNRAPTNTGSYTQQNASGTGLVGTQAATQSGGYTNPGTGQYMYSPNTAHPWGSEPVNQWGIPR